MIAAFKAVLAAFFGVRGRKSAEAQKVKPGQIIFAAFFCALVLALAVAGLVHVLVSSQGSH
ncbi:DUF2970 domain-containing protein [Amantichitinum ursilacus]|uniref:DUF2970 domain-containing protein n=1 Tax=Amantichitinum ursilacus TaxID=857265 RepID=A0A0N0GKS2_9NEIS|nr:DUF2970 domain-containing protein [Amantichitinum ursilacus]KPC49304.1 hypothetical protein WG78_20455 [Amantichitinum ursilacus]